MIPAALKNPLFDKPWLLYAFLGTSLVLNLSLAVRPPLVVVAAGEVIAVTTPVDSPNAPIPPELVPALPEPLGVSRRAGLSVFTAAVNSSLSATFQGAPAKSPAALSAVYSRLMVWDVDLRRDLHKGDIVAVLFEESDVAEPLVLAARLTMFAGSANEKVVDGFRYQAHGDRFASYWSSTGTELPRRLIDGPLQDYEQITSLLKDRPTHEGMDFKAPIGSDIVAPRAGKVTRVNWNHAANGNCVEMQFADGATAKFLHLNENLVKEGQKVIAGEVIAKSGNTGRSTGPHLHYQIDKGGRIVDPIDYHGTLRRSIHPDLMTDFTAKVKELSDQLDTHLASAAM